MRYIRLDENKMVISEREGSEIVEGEIQSDIGLCGQIMLSDGSFDDDPRNTKEQRKQELIQLMIQDNALRDDSSWMIHKAEYDAL